MAQVVGALAWACILSVYTVCGMLWEACREFYDWLRGAKSRR